MVVLLALLGMLCWGLAPLFGKVGLSRANPFTALSVRTLLAASLVVIWNLGLGGWHLMRNLDHRTITLIGIEALLATLMGDLAYFAALKFGNINQVTLIMSASPLVTMLAAYVFLGEKFTHPQLLGAFFIMAGLILVGLEPRF